MNKRFEYQLRLDQAFPVSPQGEGIQWRNPSPNDTQILADLMLDAYRDTIDYDGETIDDALNEVQSYFLGDQNPARLDASWLAFDQHGLLSAALVSFWGSRNLPLIAYVMTGAQAKGKHLAVSVVARSLQSLAEQGFSEVRAVITEGNIPSEKVFARLGFIRMIPG